MAKWTSDWSITPLLPPKTLSKSLLFTILSIPPSSSLTHRKLIIINNSSNSPSPLLEDTSTSINVIQLSSPSSEIVISNELIQSLCRDSNTYHLAFDRYRKAKKQPDFKPEPSTLNLLIATLIELKQWSSVSTLCEDFRSFDAYPGKPTCTRLVSGCIQARQFKLVDSLLGAFETDKGTAVAAFGAAMLAYNRLHMYRTTALVFDRMRAAGVSPNAGCYLSIMDAYRKLREADRVLSLFQEIAANGLDLSAFGVRIYFVLCDSLGRSGSAFKALGYFREMVGKGISPNRSFYASLISSFAKIREAEIAEDLFEEAKEKGMIRDPAVFLKLVVMYVDLGMLEKTVKIVEAMTEMEIEVSDCVSCAIVNGYASKGGLRAALRAYERLKSLNCEFGQVTYSSVINVFSRLGLSRNAEAIFAEMISKGFDRCVIAYSNMISMYGKLGRASDAMKLLAKMKEKRCEPNVWVYNSLLDMQGRLMNLKQVEKLWKEMRRRNIEPDKVSYTSIITACNKARVFDESVKFYNEFRAKGGKVDKVLAGVMVGVFSKSNRVDELVKLLQDLKLEGVGLDGRLYKSSLNALQDAGLQSRVKWLEQNFSYEKSWMKVKR